MASGKDCEYFGISVAHNNSLFGLLVLAWCSFVKYSVIRIYFLLSQWINSALADI